VLGQTGTVWVEAVEDEVLELVVVLVEVDVLVEEVELLVEVEVEVAA